ncbi:asparaginase [Streptomyces sp. NPDC057062]|uniref:asparaginase n=1 Tax=Streptomyces sp. NPDC057062 TaxID=3346011 RepID=UPI003627292C
MAEVRRCGVVESVHHGTVVVVMPDGSVGLRLGDVSLPVLPRSTAKPLQALACLRAGADLTGAALAVAAGSHIGEPIHTAEVRRILRDAGLEENALQCPAELSGHEATRIEMLRLGELAAPVYMNCSGNHAAMLAACVASGWPTETYLDPNHPVQRLVCEVVSELAKEQVEQVAIDGCGAPIFTISPLGLARATRAMMLATPGEASRTVIDAMRSHPEFVGGSHNHVNTDLMTRMPGLVAKSGAEGTLLLATEAGHAVMVKVADGGPRAVPAIGLAALAAVGVDVDPVSELLRASVIGPVRIPDAVHVTL